MENVLKHFVGLGELWYHRKPFPLLGTVGLSVTSGSSDFPWQSRFSNQANHYTCHGKLPFCTKECIWGPSIPVVFGSSFEYLIDKFVGPLYSS